MKWFALLCLVSALWLGPIMLTATGTFAASENCCGDSESALATCTGSSSCTACKNCKYCKHCAKEGGSCGTCKK